MIQLVLAARHSALLLEQLGPPSRRATDEPLAIVLYCLQQSDQRRRMMGSRLLNLVQIIYFSLLLF